MKLKPHSINNLDNFIGCWYLDNISICDDLIAFFKNCSFKTPGLVYSEKGNCIDKTVKMSVECPLEKSKFYASYINELQKVCEEYIEKYPWCNNYNPWTVTSGINIQYYPPGGGFYTWHTERSCPVSPFSGRHLVFMTYLNDVISGGETEFYHQKLKVKPEKGLTVIWPADWTFTHRGIPALEEEKYIVTGWYNYT